MSENTQRTQFGTVLLIAGAVLMFAAYLVHQHDVARVNTANEVGGAGEVFGLGYYEPRSVNNDGPLAVAGAAGFLILFGGLTLISAPMIERSSA